MRIPEGYGQVTYHFSGTPLPYGAACTLGFHNISSSSLEDLSDMFQDGLDDLVADTCVNAVSISDILIKLGPNDDGPSSTFAVGVAGAQGSDVVPPQVTILVRKNTAHGGRQGRGRLYWPGAPESVIDPDGSWNSGALVQYQDAFDTYTAGIEASTLVDLSLLHSKVATAPYNITSFQVMPQVATQRRRNRR